MQEAKEQMELDRLEQRRKQRLMELELKNKEEYLRMAEEEKRDLLSTSLKREEQMVKQIGRLILLGFEITIGNHRVSRRTRKDTIQS